MIRVLIVDDEQACRDSLKLLLSLENFDVEVAADGQEALEVGNRFSPEILLVDWMLRNRMDGLAVAAALREVNPKLETIAISGHPSADLELNVKGLPATQYLSKPFLPAELIEAVRQAAERLG